MKSLTIPDERLSPHQRVIHSDVHDATPPDPAVVEDVQRPVDGSCPEHPHRGADPGEHGSCDGGSPLNPRPSRAHSTSDPGSGGSGPPAIRPSSEHPPPAADGCRSSKPPPRRPCRPGRPQRPVRANAASGGPRDQRLLSRSVGRGDDRFPDGCGQDLARRSQARQRSPASRARSAARAAGSIAAVTGSDKPSPTPTSSASTPITTSRRGSRPRARDSSTAADRPSA